ncbi:MAG: hypothetical protein GC180_00840 [Bacteroidetes bacterium]|nr:hypothetical protein [Bacteroidota bacterium]
MLRSNRRKASLILCGLFFQIASGQSLAELIALNEKAETQLVSGEVEMEIIRFENNQPQDTMIQKLRFYNDPIGQRSLFTLDNGNSGIYFPSKGSIAYWEDGVQYCYPLQAYESRYCSQFRYKMEVLCLGILPNIGRKTWLIQNQKSFDEKGYFHAYEPETRTVSVERIIPIEPGKKTQYLGESVTYSEEGLPLESSKYYRFEIPDTTISRISFRVHYRYSHLNQVPYFVVKKDVDQLGEEPLVQLEEPQKMEIDSHPLRGQAFPDLHLLNKKGTASRLSDIHSKKLLIYHRMEDSEPFFRFVDSLSSVYPDLQILILNHSQNSLIDNPGYPQFIQNHLFAYSRVEGLYVNGFPVWYLVDEENHYLSENHGFQMKFAMNITDWLNYELKHP